MFVFNAPVIDEERCQLPLLLNTKGEKRIPSIRNTNRIQGIQGTQRIYRGSKGYNGATGDTKGTVGVKGEKAVLLYQGYDGDPEYPVDVENMLEMRRILEIQDIY